MSMLQLPDVKRALNIAGDDRDGLLLDYIDAAEDLVGAEVGPLTVQTITGRVRAGANCLALPVTPVVSVVSMTGVTVGDLHIDADAGVVTGTFSAGVYDVVYTAGWAEVPVGLKQATIALLRHLWTQEQRGSGRRPGSGGQTDDERPAGYLIPYAVAAQLSKYSPGVAFA